MSLKKDKDSEDLTPEKDQANTEGTGLDEITAEIEASIPGVNEEALDAVEKENEQGSNIPQWQTVLTDQHGRKYAPDVHIVDDKGNPVLNARGKLRIKPGKGVPKKKKGRIGRKSKPIEKINLEAENIQPEEQPGADNIENAEPGAPGAPVLNIPPEALAGLFTNLTFSTMTNFLGDEGKPIKTESFDEYRQHLDAWTYYLKAKNIENLPPGQFLIATMVTSLLMRISMPKTKEKVSSFGSWMKGKIKKIYRKVFKDGTRIDTRNDREREDDIGNEAESKTITEPAYNSI